MPLESLGLCLAGLGLEALYLRMAQLKDLRQHATPFLVSFGLAVVVYLGVVWIVRRLSARALPTPRWLLGVVMLGAVVFRCTLLGTTPSLSDDIYRYLWDGRVQQTGINPYRYAPSDPTLAGLRDTTWSPINHKDIPTVYPPLSQVLFHVGAWASPTIQTQRLLFLVCDLLIVALLVWALPRWGGSPLMSLIYAWHPLVVVEVASSGHNDPLGVFWLLAGLFLWTTRHRLAGTVALALAFLSKLISLLLWPFFLLRARRLLLVFLAVALAGYLPFLGGHLIPGQGHYSGGWEFNSSLYSVIHLVVGHPFLVRLVCVLGVVVAGFLLARRRDDLVGYTIRMLQVGLLLTPVLEPWYLLWLIPLLCLRPSWAWLIFSGCVGLSYAVLIGYPQDGVWQLPLWVKWVEYGPLYTWLLWRVWNRPLRSQKQKSEVRTK